MKRRVAFFISMLFVVISISGCSKYLGGATEENNSVKEEKQGLLFSTEYEVQDYFNGYFIVSKLQGKLCGVIDDSGNEIIPLKYTSVVFENKKEMADGRNDELNFIAEDNGVKIHLNANGELGGSCKIKSIIGAINDERQYYAKSTSTVYVADSTKKNILYTYSIDEGELVDFYQITDGYELLVAETGMRSEKVYLMNKLGDAIWEKSCTTCTVQKKGDNVIIYCQDFIGKAEIYTMDIEGNMNLVDNYYKDDFGIHYGKKPEGLVDYILGPNDNIYLKRTGDKFYKLINKNGNNLAYDKYIEISRHEDIILLLNENQGVTMVNSEGKIVKDLKDFEWRTSESSDPEYLGKCIYYDKVFGAKDALYIVRENGEKNDVYRIPINQ